MHVYARVQDLGHEQALQHNAVELGVRAAGQEAVQLKKEDSVNFVEG
jgi:hypothetical protein